jgi:hypothetical protein
MAVRAVRLATRGQRGRCRPNACAPRRHTKRYNHEHMSTARELGLRLLPYFPEPSDSKEEPLIYSVEGLPDAHFVLIGSAGTEVNATRRWYVNWYQDTVMIPSMTRLHDSPDEALEAVAKSWSAHAE